MTSQKQSKHSLNSDNFLSRRKACALQKSSLRILLNFGGYQIWTSCSCLLNLIRISNCNRNRNGKLKLAVFSKKLIQNLQTIIKEQIKTNICQFWWILLSNLCDLSNATTRIFLVIPIKNKIHYQRQFTFVGLEFFWDLWPKVCFKSFVT